MAVSQYDKENLLPEQREEIENATIAAKNGEMTWAEAHEIAEGIRASAGYSGGQYGDQYMPSSSSSGGSSGAAAKYNGVEYTVGDGGIYNMPTYNSTVKNYQQDGINYHVGPYTAHNPDLAGKTILSNGYTVVYDENGYAIKASKGTADYTPHLDYNAANGSYNADGAWTDLEMMRNNMSDFNRIQSIRNDPNMTPDEKNAAANAIRAGYGYSIDKNGYVTDFVALNSTNDRREKLGLGTNEETAAQEYTRYLMNTDLSAYAQAQGNVQDFQTWAAENGYGAAVPQGTGSAGSVAGSSGGTSSGLSGSGAELLRELYAAVKESQLAALESTYEQNLTEIKSAQERLPELYQAARNQAAAQNDISRQAFHEVAAARGLNSGTSGQAELTRSAVLQGNLSNISTQLAGALANNELEQEKLGIAYRNAVDEARAQSDASLVSALYNEYVRQTTADTAAANQAQQYAYNLALNLAQQGVQVPDSLLSAAGLSRDAMQSLWLKTTGEYLGPSGSYDNGIYTVSQIQNLQRLLNVTPDGKWGLISAQAAGRYFHTGYALTADAAMRLAGLA